MSLSSSFHVLVCSHFLRLMVAAASKPDNSEPNLSYSIF